MPWLSINRKNEAEKEVLKKTLENCKRLYTMAGYGMFIVGGYCITILSLPCLMPFLKVRSCQ
jgi:hypothetical protein